MVSSFIHTCVYSHSLQLPTIHFIAYPPKVSRFIKKAVAFFMMVALSSILSTKLHFLLSHIQHNLEILTSCTINHFKTPRRLRDSYLVVCSFLSLQEEHSLLFSFLSNLSTFFSCSLSLSYSYKPIPS